MLVGLVLVVLPFPESLLAGAGGIIVRWAGAVTLFPLACTTENDLQCCRDQKENAAEYESQLRQFSRMGVLTHWRWQQRTRLFANYKKHDAQFQLVSC